MSRVVFPWILPPTPSQKTCRTSSAVLYIGQPPKYRISNFIFSTPPTTHPAIQAPSRPAATHPASPPRNTCTAIRSPTPHLALQLFLSIYAIIDVSGSNSLCGGCRCRTGGTGGFFCRLEASSQRRAVSHPVSLGLRGSRRLRAAGSVKQKVAPLPGPALSTLMPPPIVSTRAREMASPTPEPPPSRERDFSTL